MYDDNYINIQGWMVTKLDLRGNHLLLFAIISGFSQDRMSYFTGSSKYLQNITGVTRNTVTKCLNEMIDQGLIIKETYTLNSISFNKFKTNWRRVEDVLKGICNTDTPYQNLTHPLSEIDTPPYQNLTGGLSNFDTNNTNNNKLDIIKEDNIGADAQKSFSDDLFGSSFLPIPNRKKEKSCAKKEKSFGRPEFRQTLIDLGSKEQHVDDWMKVRDSKKAVFTATALQGFLNECDKHNFPISEAVRICAEKSWQGFKYQWIINENNNGKQTTAHEDRKQRASGVQTMGDLARQIVQDAINNSQAGS